MPVLHISTHGRESVKYDMTEESVSIGRQTGCTIVLAKDTGISGKHCRIQAKGRGFVVEDTGSANGTRVNGRPIGKASLSLCSGDCIRIGSTEIEFDDPLSPRRSWVSKVWASIVGSSKNRPESWSKTCPTCRGRSSSSVCRAPRVSWSAVGRKWIGN